MIVPLILDWGGVDITCDDAIVGIIADLLMFTIPADNRTGVRILGGVAVGSGLTAGSEMNILVLIIPVALSATCAFMFPAATPPNAIAFDSGYVKIGDMIKGGIWLNLIAVVLITLATYSVAVPVFGLVI